MKRFLKNGLAISVFVVMLISCMGLGSLVAAPQIQILAPAGQNLVTNGNFEDPNSTAWAFGEGVSISSAAKRSGNYGLEMKSAVYDTRANFEFSQIALAPNTRYVVTADTCTNGLPLSCDFNVTGGEATVEKGTLTSSWTNVTILTIQTHTEYVFGKIAFEIYRDASATGNKAAYIDNVTMIATGNEWCPTPNGGMTMGTGIDEHFDSSTLKNGTLDKDVWLVSNTAWGGANGGLNSANVKLGTKDGRSVCILESHGDQYTGNVQGVGGNTTRVGSGIVTRDYYASARYTVVCKIEPVLGVCTAYWSFSYVGYMQDDTNGDGKADFYDQGDGLWEYNKLHNKDENGWIQENGVRNSEIDWETPSPMDDGGENDVVSHNNLRTNCWGGKRPGEGGNYSGRSHQNNNATISIADGNWHELVYEWFGLDNPYTTKVNDPAVIWFIDGVRVDGYDINNQEYTKNDDHWYHDEAMGAYISSEFTNGGIEVPRYGTRFWLATWFPVKESKLYCVGQSAYTGWAGTPDYDTTYTYIDSCTIVPYTNGGTSYKENKTVKPQYLGNDGKDLGDEYNVIETVPNKQFALPSEYPNYAVSVNTLDAPDPVTQENGSVVTVSWNAISGATDYDIMVDGKKVSGVTSPYTVSNMGIGNHTFKLRARNSTKTGIWSREALVSVGTPKNLRLTANGHSVVATWDPVAGAVDYYMEIDNNPIIVNGAYVSFESGDTNCGWLQGFSDNSTHMVRVKAVGVRGVSNWSGLQQITIAASGVPIPDLVLKNSDSDKYSFSAIISRISGATAYQLKNSDTGEIIDVPLDGSGYPTKQFSGMQPGIYRFSARAQSSGTWSDWGTMQTVAVAQDEILPAPGVRADAINDTSIDVYWNDVPGATGYDIEIDGVVINNVTSTYHHTGLTKGQTYTYRVRSKNNSQTSAWSSRAFAIPGGGGDGPDISGTDPQYTGNGKIKNGHFDNELNYWNTDGNTNLSNGKVTLSGGEMSAILSQTVFGMKANTDYTFMAELSGPGLGQDHFMYVYVRNADGTGGEVAYEMNDLPFTIHTGALKDDSGVTFIFSVYKGQTGSITVDNVSLSEGTSVTSEVEDTTATTKNTTSNSSSVSTNSSISTTSNYGPVTYGDANEDGSIDMKDVLAIRKRIANMAISGTFNAKNADANGDSSIDMKDVLMVRKYIAKMIDRVGP